MRWGLLVLVALAAAALVTWPGPARSTAAPTTGDCAEIAVWSNGFHTSLSIPAAILHPEHPLRQAMPDAPYLLVGWGDAGFYRDGPGLWRGLDAIVPPSPSVIHLIGADEPVERFYTPTRLQRAALSSSQAAGLAAFLAREVAVVEGQAMVVGQGHAGPGSLFLEGRSSFHGLYVCNHWTARALRAAGLSVGSRLSYRADGVLDDLARSAPAACPAG